MSEVYGRTRPLFFGFAIFIIFQIPLAVAQNLTTIMLSRFLAGCFGAAPIAIVGGTYVDFWDAKGRGAATAGFAGATFLGPVRNITCFTETSTLYSQQAVMSCTSSSKSNILTPHF